MVFTSLIYVLFLLFILVVYFGVRPQHQVLFLLASSYCFYAYWKPQYLLLLVAITTVDFFAAIGIEHAATVAMKRFSLGISIAANLGILFFYKYYDFLASQINAATQWVGLESRLPIFDLLIPLGISFHTFQSISYTIDVARGACKAERNYLNLALFISFFPQLVAGPIERASHLLPQLVRTNRFEISNCMSGVLLVAYGFFKKLVLADNLAVFADQYFSSRADASGGLCLLAVYAFAFQIYFDFSGYTDIARGSGRMLGIQMIENFRAPYFSTSVREFWRQWHISLTDWFREFVYRPLLDRGYSRTLCIATVFALSGIWHGANWTFLIWGLLNAAFYFVMADNRRLPHLTTPAVREVPADVVFLAVVRCLVTFNLISLTWVFFRATTVGEALGVIRNIAFGSGSFQSGLSQLAAEHPTRILIVLVALVFDGWLAFKYSNYAWIDYLTTAGSWKYWGAFTLLVYVTLFLGQLGAEQFIYFQF